MSDGLDTLIDRLRKRAEDDRQYAANNTIVRDLLQPQLDAFDRRDGTHNTYAVRMQLDHRNSAKRDAQYADDLDAAVAILDLLKDSANEPETGKPMENRP